MIRNISFTITIFSILFLWTSCSSPDNPTKSSSQSTELKPAESSSKKDNRKVILFFGNSLTAGLGVDSRKNFVSLTQLRLDSLGYPYRVINAGVSGETTSSGNSRVDWVIERQPVDVFVLELGANDGLRGIPTEETHQNLCSIIDKVKKAHPGATIILCGMMIPPNMGPDYSNKFKMIFPTVAKEKNVKLLPFLLKDVAGYPKLNQADGIHPTPEGHKIVADNVWEVLVKELVK